MCSSRSLCDGNNFRNNRSRGSSTHYALCALGVGLVALGIIMIVWSLIPPNGDTPTTSSPFQQNNNITNGPENDTAENNNLKNMALVVVVFGIVLLMLSICLGVRSKRASSQTESMRAGVPFMDNIPGQEQPTVDPEAYNVPSYDEVVGSTNYPVRQSNLRHSTSQLPSYEDILEAVENEGSQPANDQTPAGPSDLASQPDLPRRSASRASRLLKPLKVRRIKSDKLHLKDFRLQIRTPTQNPVTIEPITPPPQYDNKIPKLQ